MFYIYIYGNKFSSQKILLSKGFCYSFFDDYIFAGNRFQLVQGLESSFHALDLIVSQQSGNCILTLNLFDINLEKNFFKMLLFRELLYSLRRKKLTIRFQVLQKENFYQLSLRITLCCSREDFFYRSVSRALLVLLKHILIYQVVFNSFSARLLVVMRVLLRFTPNHLTPYHLTPIGVNKPDTKWFSQQPRKTKNEFCQEE